MVIYIHTPGYLPIITFISHMNNWFLLYILETHIYWAFIRSAGIYGFISVFWRMNESLIYKSAKPLPAQSTCSILDSLYHPWYNIANLRKDDSYDTVYEYIHTYRSSGHRSQGWSCSAVHICSGYRMTVFLGLYRHQWPLILRDRRSVFLKGAVMKRHRKYWFEFLRKFCRKCWIYPKDML